MSAHLPSPTTVITLLLLAACEGGPGSADGKDPFAKRKFAELTSEMLRANALPEGYRLGDPVPATPPPAPGAQPTEPAWRVSRDPNASTLYVAARGPDSRVDYVSWVFEDSHRPSIELLTGAGIRLGEVVALARVPARNWSRLSQGHAQDERFEAFVQSTDRPNLYVQRMGHDAALDSLVWCASPTALLAHDERFDVAIARQQLDAAMAARDEATVVKYRYWLRAVPESDLRSQVERAEELLASWAQEHDAPILAELAALRSRHDQAWTDANDDARVRLWAADHDAAFELWRRLKRAKSEVPDAIQAQWLAFARERDVAANGALPDSARGFFWRYALAAPRSTTEVVTCWVRANELDSEDSMYFQTVDQRTRLAEGEAPMLAPTLEVDQVVRRLLARQLRREAAADRAADHALRADWIEQGVLLALEQLEVPATHRYPFVSGAEYLRTWNEVTKYEELVASKARVGLRVLALNAMTNAEANAAPERAQRTGFSLTFMTGFVAREREKIAVELRAEAEAAAALGHFATATVLALQADDALLRAPGEVQGLATAPQPGSTTHYARQFLVQVLPPIDEHTAQGWRLCELLAEGEQAEWPLVRDLAIRVLPGDVPKLRHELGLPSAFAHLVRTGAGDDIALVEKSQSSDPTTDERFWAAYSGRSNELLEESKWISSEGAWLRPEGEWIGKEEAELLVERDRLQAEMEALDRDFTAHKARASSVSTYDDIAVRAYNAAGSELLDRQTKYNQKAEANRARTDAYNARVRTRSDRVATYNRRLAAYNEKCMREGAAGYVALDAKLKPALLAAVRDGLARWEAAVLARSQNSLARDMEVLFGKALLGQHESRPELWTRPIGKGYARLVADSTLRAAARQSTNREYANHVVTWWRWAGIADMKEREQVLDFHFDEFVRHRDPEDVKAAIRAGFAGDLQQQDVLLQRLEARRVEFFGAK